MRILFIFVLCLNAQAATLTFLNPCSEDIFLQSSLKEKNLSLGLATVKVLESEQVNFIGSEIGIHTLLGTPAGEQALEIVSREEMYAYGWCYSVNNELFEFFPHQIELKEDDQVTWWFGFAHYKRGEWLSQCERASLRAANSVCQAIESYK
jgi:hypothetical protein